MTFMLATYHRICTFSQYCGGIAFRWSHPTPGDQPLVGRAIIGLSGLVQQAGFRR